MNKVIFAISILLINNCFSQDERPLVNSITTKATFTQSLYNQNKMYIGGVEQLMKIEDVSGYGFTTKISFNIMKFDFIDLHLNMSGGYEYCRVKQDNKNNHVYINDKSEVDLKFPKNIKTGKPQWISATVDEFDWKYFNIRYIDYVAQTLRNGDHIADFEIVQELKILPYDLSLSGKIDIDDDFYIEPSLGAGLITYNRSFYVIENWTKKAVTIAKEDTTKFLVNVKYNDFGTEFKGNPIYLVFGTDLCYNIYNSIYLNFSTNYRYIVPTRKEYGFDHFPAKDLINYNIGLTFKY